MKPLAVLHFRQFGHDPQGQSAWLAVSEPDSAAAERRSPISKSTQPFTRAMIDLQILSTPARKEPQK